jgi:hypothetical protein
LSRMIRKRHIGVMSNVRSARTSARDRRHITASEEHR